MPLSETILSYPVPVRMAGFESTTVMLQRNGWELSMQQDFSRDALRLAMRHNIWNVYAVSNSVRVNYYQFKLDSLGAWRGMQGFDIQYVSAEMYLQVISTPVPFKAIDAVPEVSRDKIVKMDDLNIFKTVDHSQDIILDPKDVNALMEQVLKLQDPKQAEIREKKRRERMQAGMPFDCAPTSPPSQMHAQIISLVA